MSSKPGSKSKESSESWDSLFRKTLSKDRLLTFTRPVENPIHWIHLLDPFDQQDTRTAFKSTATREGFAAESSPRNLHTSGEKLPHLKFPEAVIALAQAAAKASGESRASGPLDLSGWPLMPFSKVQMFKCEKCCLEFCSPVNHRRHLRVIHRRAPHAEKEDLKSQRQQLATFWDSLSPQEASKIVDMKNLALEDLAGEKVARALSQLLQQPGLFALPHSYVKSGAMLLELVQCRSSRLLLTSSELFKFLDGSSEKTFPSFGLNAMQRYVFEGGAGKVGLEAKNLVSSLGFLVELNLVKAFIKDKDEEAWRCQTALVEEEEASRRKRAQIQEKKKMRKARQRDTKEKESKPSDSSVASPSPSSDSSDDEDLSSFKHAAGHNLPSRPSSNAFENLYYRLAGEDSDTDYNLEAISASMLEPFKTNHSLGEPGEADETKLAQGISDVICSVSQGELVHDSTKVNEDKSGLEEAVESGVSDSLNEGTVQATSGKKPLFSEKRKYPPERSLEEREIFIPLQKQVWKERHHWSVRSFPKQIVANNCKEVAELAYPEVASFQSRQLLGKPTRVKRYHMEGQTGASVWTKKVPKSCDTACDTTGVGSDCTDLTSDDMCQPSVKEPEVSAEVSVVDSLHSSVPSGTGCVLSTECSCGPSQQANLAADDCGTGNKESQISASVSSDLGHCHEPYQAGQALSSVPSVVVGTVVIGSFSVSLVDSKIGQDQIGMPLSTPEDVMDGSKVVEATKGEPTGSVQLSKKLEESVRALHENGAINCASDKDLEKDAKSAKIALRIDSEEKENHEHSLNLGGDVKSSRPIVVQGGNSRGGRLKVWRPVVSTNSHETHDRLVNSCPTNRNTPTIQSSVMTEESNKSVSVDSEELQQGGQDPEGVCVDVGHETKELVKLEVSAVEMGSIVSSVSSSTFEAVSCFLSQRWSAAVSDPDTVVLSVDDEEECKGQNDGVNEDTNEHVRISRNSPPQESKVSSGLPGNGKPIRGYWKQGCAGDAVAAGQRLSGKSNSFSGAPRLAGYRYVPK